MMRCFGWFFNWKFAHCQGLNIGTRPHHMQQKLCVCVLAKWAKMRRKNIFRETQFHEIFRGVDFMEKFHKMLIFYPLLRLPKSSFFSPRFISLWLGSLGCLPAAWSSAIFFCTKVEFALTGFCNSKVIHSYFRTTTTFFVPKNH